MATIGSVVVEIGGDTSGFDSAVGKIKGSMDKFGSDLKGAGATLSGAITAPIVGIGIAAIKMSTDLNGAMANVATLIPNNTKRIEELKASVQNMSIAVGKSTGDLADGLYQVISTFGDTADSTKILEIQAKAAAAGMATTTDAINLTAAVTKGYGDTSMATVQKVSDLAFQTANLGITTFPELASSMGKVVPLASSMGVNMETLFGTMATATGVTGTAAEVTTQLRGILQSLAAPTKTMSNLFHENGVASGKAMLAQFGLQGTINKIVEASNKTGVPLQKYISQIEGQTLATTLAGNQSKDFTDKLAAMQNVAGATDQAFQQQTQGINKNGFAWEQAKAKMQVAAQQLGDGLGPALSKVADAAKPLLDKIGQLANTFASMSPEQQQQIITWAGIAAAIGPVLVVLGTLVSAVGKLIPLFKLLSPVILKTAESEGVLNTVMQLNPIFLWIAAIVAVIAVGILLYKHWGEITAWLSKTWEQIKAVAKALWDTIFGSESSSVDGISVLQDYFGKIGTIIGDIVWAVRNAITAVVSWVTTKANEIGTFLTAAWNTITVGVTTAWNAILQFFVGLWTGIVTWITTKVNEIGTFLTTAWSTIVVGVTTAWNAVLQFFVDLWNGIVTWISTKVNEIGTWLTNAWITIKTGVTNGWNAILAFLREWWGTILLALITGGLLLLILIIVKNWDLIKQATMNAWNNTIAWLRNTWNGMVAWGVTTWTNLYNGVVAWVMQLVTDITTWFTLLPARLTAIWNGIVTYLLALWNNLVTSALLAWNTLYNGVVQWVMQTVADVTTWFTLLPGRIQATWNSILAYLLGVWNSMVASALAAWNNLYNAVVTWVMNIVNAVVNWFDALPGRIDAAWWRMRVAANTAWENLKKTAVDGARSAKDGIVNGFTEAVTWLEGMPGRLLKAGKDLIGALVDGFLSMSIPVPSFNINWKAGPAGIQLPSLDVGLNWKSLKSMVPFLADGGIVNGPTLAMIGEAGSEAVVPLDRMGDFGGGGGKGMTLIVEMDGRQMARQTLRYVPGEVARAGVRVI